MGEALVVSAVRTPIGRAFKGSLRGIDAFGLAETVLAETIARSGIPADVVDDLVLAESYQGGGVIARNVAVRQGLLAIPGMAQNRHCASGLSAVSTAAAGVLSGMDGVVFAGGTESMSTQPGCIKPDAEGNPAPWRSIPNPDQPGAPAMDMPLTVGENTARHAGLTRRDLDEWALYSHERAIESIDNGWFADEIVPVELGGGADPFTTDEHPRRGGTLESMAKLPVLHPELDDATITAGNSAGLNDAAAMVSIVSDSMVTGLGVTPIARIRSWASVGVDPALTGTGPIHAIPKALDRAGVSIADVDRFEINEAFASVPVAAVRALGLDQQIVNVNGSGCSLGHPIAATGTRMLVTMINELRRNNLSIGCIAMCAGGGMGSAMVVETL